MKVDQVLRAAFIELRLAPKIDKELLETVLSKVQGFSRRLIALYYLNNLIQNDLYLTDEEKVSLLTNEKKALGKEFSKLSKREKMDQFRLTVLFCVKKNSEINPLEDEPPFMDFFKD